MRHHQQISKAVRILHRLSLILLVLGANLAHQGCVTRKVSRELTQVGCGRNSATKNLSLRGHK
jgi:hypothetical protein